MSGQDLSLDARIPNDANRNVKRNQRCKRDKQNSNQGDEPQRVERKTMSQSIYFNMFNNQKLST